MLSTFIILAALAIPPAIVPVTIGVAVHEALTHKEAIVEKLEPIRADAAIWWRETIQEANESSKSPMPV